MYSPNVFIFVTSRRTRGAGLVGSMHEGVRFCTALVWDLFTGREYLGDLNIDGKKTLKYFVGTGCMRAWIWFVWIKVASGFCEHIKEPISLIKPENFLTCCASTSFSRRILIEEAGILIATILVCVATVVSSGWYEIMHFIWFWHWAAIKIMYS